MIPESVIGTTLIKKPKSPNGWCQRWVFRKQNTEVPIAVYNRRGKLVLWIGAGILPANGPALWFVAAVCFISGLVGGHL